MAHAAPAAPAVHLRAAVVLLGRFPALAGVDLDAGAGEVVHVRGANGAGKSTLLRLCAGLTAPADGQAAVLGEDLTTSVGRRAVRRRVGLLAHDSFLYEDLTVAENVRFWVRASGGDPAQVGPALERVGLAGRLPSTTAGRLSAGQRRRAGLAALVARRPQLWLLDEPHAGLDGSARDVVDALVTGAAAEGATVVFASHELERAEAIATRTVTLAGGRARVPEVVGAA